MSKYFVLFCLSNFTYQFYLQNTMDSNMAKDALNLIYYLLKRNNITLSEIINYGIHTSNEKKSPKIGNPFWHEKQCIFTNQPSYFWLFLAIFAYFCLFA